MGRYFPTLGLAVACKRKTLRNNLAEMYGETIDG